MYLPSGMTVRSMLKCQTLDVSLVANPLSAPTYWPRAHEKTFTKGGDVPGKKTPPHWVVNFKGMFWFFEVTLYTTGLVQPFMAGLALAGLTALTGP